jgi:hypothetical protein
MEGNFDSVDPVIPSSYPTSSNSKLGFKKNLLKWLVIIGVCLVIFTAGILVYYLSSFKVTEIPVAAIPLNITSTPVPSGPANEKNTIEIAILENGKVTTIDKFSFDRYMGSSFSLHPEYHNGALYFIDGTKIKKYMFDSKSIVDVYAFTVPKERSFDEFTIDRNMLYMSFGAKGNYGDEKVLMKEINLETGIDREIPNVETVFYGTAQYLFKSKNGKDITSSHGGDGCGGWGSYYRYENRQSTLLAESGIGCVDKPRHLGFLGDQDQLIMANGEIYQDKDSEEINPFQFRYDVLYALDVNTGVQIPLYDLKKISGISVIQMNEEKTKLAMLTEGEIHIFDLQSKGITTVVKLNKKIGSILMYAGDKIYAHDSELHTLNTVNVSTSTIDVIENIDTETQYFPYIFAGDYNGKMYLYNPTY